MKRIVCTLLSLVLLCAFAMPAFAMNEADNTDNVTISAEVPSTHKVTVRTDGGADVVYDGKTVTSFDAPRLGTPQLVIRAESGRQIKSVLLNGTDITDKLEGGKYTFAPVYEEQTLTVITENEPTAENVATFTVEGTVTKNGHPLSGITLELRSELKTAVTGKDGKFRFEKVKAGQHSLTAIRDGEIVGYMEFTLSGSADKVNFTLTDGRYEVFVPDNTATVHLELALDDDGGIGINNVTAQKTPAKPGDSPQTGDSTAGFIWVLLAAVSCGMLVLCASGMLRRRKKQKQD